MVHHTKMRMSEKGAQNFNDVVRVFYIHFMCEGPFFCIQKLVLYLEAPTIFAKCERYDVVTARI